MYYPDIEEFKRLSEKGNLIPVYREILADIETPVSAFMKIKEDHSFLLESVVGGEKWARYSFLCASPSKIIKAKGNRVEILNGKELFEKELDDPIIALKDELSKYTPVYIDGLPRFYGGLIGYIGYETVKFFDRVPDSPKPSLNLPDIFFMVADTILIFDSLRQKIKVVSNAHVFNKMPEEAYYEAVENIDKMINKLKTEKIKPEISHFEFGSKSSSDFKKDDFGFSSSFNSKDDFLDAVKRSKEYIVSGDVVQVVISQRFESVNYADPFNIYRALRIINPSPYMFYLSIGEAEIVGSSPEILVRFEDNRVTVRPIAGTRKRGDTEDEDIKLEKELIQDPKEKAEHIMLVDLGRNDVGRVAKKGTVNVTEMMSIERYSHVMHIVSNVEGIIEEGLDAFDVFRACFPAGTVTGAPKIRAMEIIDELEPVKRGPYAGAVGYIGYSGSMDTCITIRTLIIKEGKIFIQAGAGIVADSIPENEYNETINKAKGMMHAVEIAAEL